VNGREAKVVWSRAGVVDWTVEVDAPADGQVSAHAADQAGNVEKMAHVAH
jgi:hypothetical protein